MLDLQDFPGQGSALVGILDAFMDSKGIVTPETFRGFCADVYKRQKLYYRGYCYVLFFEKLPAIEVDSINSG